MYACACSCFLLYLSALQLQTDEATAHIRGISSRNRLIGAQCSCAVEVYYTVSFSCLCELMSHLLSSLPPRETRRSRGMKELRLGMELRGEVVKYGEDTARRVNKQHITPSPPQAGCFVPRITP